MKKNGIPKIEKGIPIPARVGGHRNGFTALLRKLGKGDSVVLPYTSAQANRAASHVFGVGKYAVRKTDDGCRIWRK